ncbi:hypothetical protein COEREDRAFT_79719 [Coemansia reversa NRRL 1564]|uniref:Muskelin N-terminal domain-containing protein n=1 Tax=Coemansia reversa (strain ATCC 12441 / NRRL 1564) TaxID=763665 RepID=A0A2G5BI97_COERN|nr:hypothetical protein COEREDRAFT_79719 [Coemansia reversa NRRL 1564]|eukprot:PIA18725.1 hypothetical protein COEREDRAFT_79719 [Coemansia reversa NRRL 1564]
MTAHMPGAASPENNGGEELPSVNLFSATAPYGDYDSSSAPFMTNPNYRVVLPASVSDTSATGAGQSRLSLTAASASLPSWISPTTQSKTYFPASSPIIGSTATGGDAFNEDAGSAQGDISGSMDKDGTAMQMDCAQELRTEYDILPYEIHAWSNYSANFLPHNILTDRPHDQASRWSTNANNHRQFITLRLERPALIRLIKFGKFYKTHVCNLKEFKVFGGMTEDNMIELLYSGLRNDSEAETISLRQKLHGHYIPCQYIKIQPLLAYDQKFNFSIWHLELRGTMDLQIMHSIMNNFMRFKEQEVVRACLKFFRDRNYSNAFGALSQQSIACLEAPILSEIRSALVEEGNYDHVEKLLYQAERSGMFLRYSARVPYASAWSPIETATYVMPPPRGGHQMCMDEDSRVAYLFGGWDGTSNLDDLWMYNLDTHKWICISMNTRDQGGPGPRSCHSMCFDSVQKCIYIMGKYIDHEFRGSTSLDNDLYCYDTINNEWVVLSENTEVMNGPKLVFNTQMVFDPRFCRIYIYGGKVVLPDASDSTMVYSGLYCFDLRKHRWTKLKPDFHMLDQEQHVRGRYFHSLLIDPDLQRLYIISSKRDVTVPSNLIIYDIATDTFFEKMADLNTSGTANQPITQERFLSEKQRLSPAHLAMHNQSNCVHPDFGDHHPVHVHLLQDGRTIRATLDTKRQEIYVLASVQSDAHTMSSGPLLQSLMSTRSGRRSDLGYHDQGGVSTPYIGSLYTQSFGAGFHPSSRMMGSGLHCESERSALSSSGSALGRGDRRSGCKNSAGGAQRQYQPRLERILMVVLCYHIPTETWTEVHNSARSLAQFESMSNNRSYTPSDDIMASQVVDEDCAIYRPSFPPPRFAQDWVFDSISRKHIMFGGNPNRPSDKSARLNDTWELELTRPDSGDILRRTLCLVRQRRFLDMCVGAEPLITCNTMSSKASAPGDSHSVDDYSASAIPSPNSALLGSPELANKSVKRASSPSVEERTLRHQSQHHKKVFASDASISLASVMGPTRVSTLKPVPTAVSPCITSSRERTAQALAYLQQYVAPLVNHADPNECQTFHALSTALFQMSSDTNITSKDLCKARADVFEALLIYFPESQQQPSTSLDNAMTMMLS